MAGRLARPPLMRSQRPARLPANDVGGWEQAEAGDRLYVSRLWGVMQYYGRHVANYPNYAGPHSISRRVPTVAEPAPHRRTPTPCAMARPVLALAPRPEAKPGD